MNNTEKSPSFEAKESALGIIYQIIVAIDLCYKMSSDNTIWIEKDGDISFYDGMDSAQIEVKCYSDELTSKHRNFWKTLGNWLSAGFDHHKFKNLIIHTTQEYGAHSKLRNWNNLSADQKVELLEAIGKTEVSPEAIKKGSIIDIRNKVLASDKQELKIVLGKIKISSGQSDFDQILRNICHERLIGIPSSNHMAYIQGLVGFFSLEINNPAGWSISYEKFREKNIQLTEKYSLKKFTFPSFCGDEATEIQITEHSERRFVEKIKEIQHEEAIPEAIGNWIELQQSLKEELESFPQFRESTNRYQQQIVRDLAIRHRIKARSCTDWIKDSQDFYDTSILEQPQPFDTGYIPHKAYRNGLIHDAMDKDAGGLKWKISLTP